MRILIAIVALAAGSPAAAQPYIGLTRSLDAQRAAEAQAARGREAALSGQIEVLHGDVETNDRLNSLAAARANVGPPIYFDPMGPPPRLEMSQMTQIPDAILAASNARAVAASQNRR